MRRHFIVFMVVAIIAGCSAEHYRRSADLDVQALLRDREKQTLDYQPQVEVPTPIVTTVPKKAYDKIPFTPIPPKAPPPIEIEHVEVPFAPLGPELPRVFTQRQSDDSSADDTERLTRPTIGPPAPGPAPRKFDLFASLQYAVQHSRTYQSAMETLYIAALDVTAERHLFTPIPSADTVMKYNGGQATSQFKSAFAVTQEFDVRQKLPWGGSVTAGVLVDFVNAISGNADDGETATVALAGSLPLLRGFGMVNLERWIASERNLVYQVRTFEEFRREFAVDIAADYFDLLQAQQGIGNRRINLATSTDLRVRSQALFDANRLIGLEVQRARQAELQALAQVINSEESYQSQLDRFKVKLGMSVEDALDVVAVEMEVPIPRIAAEDAIQLAQKYRLDLVTASDRVDDAMRNVKNARNGLLPDLDLAISTSVGNEENSPAADLQSRTLKYDASLRLGLPIDRLVERNDYRVSLINLGVAQRNLAGKRDDVTSQVRDALRRIAGAVTNLQIQQVGIDLAQRRVEFANIRLNQGAANSNRDVVEAQGSLLQAQDLYEQAKSQLRRTVLQYLQVTGTLRIDPDSGTLGRVMDRAAQQANNSQSRR